MDFTQRDLYNIMSRDYMLGNTTVDEQVEFISDQIKQPFDSGNTNYFKRLKKMVSSNDQMDHICSELFKQIENIYPNIEIDPSESGQHYAQYFSAIYKFFIKNAKQLMFIFLREYLYNNKNRKGLVMDFMSNKLPSYPKEQYGKKEFYILITKLSSIVKTIPEDNIRLEKFIDYIDRTDEDAPLYLTDIRDMLDKGIIIDHGVVSDMFDQFEQSDSYAGVINKLEMSITKDLIIPYLKENGLMDIRIPTPMEPEEDISDSDDDSNESEEVSE